jgi:Tfp pilus assembly pilus retraction ATPase PilT
MHSAGGESEKSGQARPPSNAPSSSSAQESLDLLVGYRRSHGIPFTFKQLMGVLVKHSGDFLHLNFNSPPILRLDGELVPVGDRVLSREDCRTLILGELTPSRRELLLSGQELSYLSSEAEFHFRIHVYLDRSCPALTLTKVRSETPALVELGLSGGSVETFLQQKQGMLLVTGNANSGKITTFSALASHLTRKREGRILTLETRIEYCHKNQEANIIQREIGNDSKSFTEAIRSAQYQDIDVLAVGDIPNRESLEMLLEFANNGMLVVGCFDAPNIVVGLDKLLRSADSEDRRFRFLLSKAIKLVVGQHLVERSDGRGQIAAFEVLESFPYVAEAIAAGDVSYLNVTMRERGMQTLARHLSRLIDVGLVNVETARQYVDAAELEVLSTPAPVAKSNPNDSASSLLSWL